MQTQIGFDHMKDWGTLVALKKYGGGWFKVKGGQGIVEAREGATGVVKKFKDGKVVGTRDLDGVVIGYYGDRFKDVKLLQFFWVEGVAKIDGKDEPAVGVLKIPSLRPIPLSSAGKTIWNIDTVPKDASPFYDENGASGIDNKQQLKWMFDGPDLAEVVAAEAAIGKNAPKGVQNVSITIHFQTFVILDKKSIFRIDWEAVGKWQKGKELGFAHTGVTGGGPNFQPVQGQLDALKDAYPKIPVFGP